MVPRKIFMWTQEIKSKQVATDRRLADLCGRIASLEKDCTSVSAVKDINWSISKVTNELTNLETPIDDTENRSRRCILLFYSLPDVASETSEESEARVTSHCTEGLSFTLRECDIKLTHRLGKFFTHTGRPVIVKFSSFKTKTLLLTKACNLKGTDQCRGWFFAVRTYCP